jgi:SNF2 family DNA or RNA helicase
MLTDFQKEILDECLKKKRGCMCLPMGTGKTIISLNIIKRVRYIVPALVVCSKTLISNWLHEIHKFYGDSMHYVVYHPEYMSKEFHEYSPNVGTDVVITTPEVVAGIYKRLAIKDHFVTKEEEETISDDLTTTTKVVVNRFHVPRRPFLSLDHPSPCSFVYSLPWKCVLVDESQQYTNVDTTKCRALSSIYSKCIRFMLSGTPINEPQPGRILGFHLLMGDDKFPNSKADAKRYLRTAYPGMRNHMVIRYQDQLDFRIPEHNEIIIAHELSENEQMLYASLKEVLKYIITRKSDDKRHGACILATISYIRQFLVCPLVPCKNLVRGTVTSIMSRYYRKVIKQMRLKDLLKSPSCFSTRILEIVKVLKKHDSERCIVFNCFRTNSIEIIKHLEFVYNDDERTRFTLNANHSISERIDIIKRFELTTNGILFLTYQLGAEGLNLQSSHIALLADPLWNVGRTDQAIARIVRRGQTENASIYLFTSNTGLEQAIFKKHIDKNKIVKRFFDGCVSNTLIHQLNIKDVLKLIVKTEVTGLLQEARDKCK